MTLITLLITLLISTLQPDPKIEKELDTYWSKLSKAVKLGDFEGYSALYHEDAILASGYTKNSYKIAKALSDWKPGFDATKAGKMQAGVEFRWSQRFHNEETAHETGIFYYWTRNSAGKLSPQYIKMNSLLIKKNGKWLMMMEYQKGPATIEEWNALD